MVSFAIIAVIVALLVVCWPEAPAPAPMGANHQDAVGVAPRSSTAAAATAGPVRSALHPPDSAPASTDPAAFASTGIVQDDLGRAVTEYRVTLAPFADESPVPGRGIAVTDPNGRFSVRHHQRGPLRLTVTSMGFAPTSIGPVSVGQSPTIRLLRLALMHGRTLGPDGRPVAAVEIDCIEVDSQRVAARTVSDENGHYELLPPRPGVYQVRVFGRAVGAPMTCRTGAPVAWDVPVLHGVEVAVRVVREDRPVRDARLTLNLGEVAWSAVTDGVGCARWRCVPRRILYARVEVDGYEAVSQRIDARDTRQSRFSVTIPVFKRRQ